MKKKNSKKDPAELFIEQIKEISGSFTTSEGTFFDDVKKSIGRIFSNQSKEASSHKENIEKNDMWVKSQPL